MHVTRRIVVIASVFVLITPMLVLAQSQYEKPLYSAGVIVQGKPYNVLIYSPIVNKDNPRHFKVIPNPEDSAIASSAVSYADTKVKYYRDYNGWHIHESLYEQKRAIYYAVGILAELGAQDVVDEYKRKHSRSLVDALEELNDALTVFEMAKRQWVDGHEYSTEEWMYQARKSQNKVDSDKQRELSIEQFKQNAVEMLSCEILYLLDEAARIETGNHEHYWDFIPAEYPRILAHPVTYFLFCQYRIYKNIKKAVDEAMSYMDHFNAENNSRAWQAWTAGYAVLDPVTETIYTLCSKSVDKNYYKKVQTFKSTYNPASKHYNVQRGKSFYEFYECVKTDWNTAADKMRIRRNHINDLVERTSVFIDIE